MGFDFGSTTARLAPTEEENAAAQCALRREVGALLASLGPRGRPADRRRDRRFPFPQLIRLTPVAADGITELGEAIVVAGKHLSECGLGFFHPAPLAHRRVKAAIEASPGHTLELLVDVHWCRFSRQGWYESGGRFLGMAPAAAAPASESQTTRRAVG